MNNKQIKIIIGAIVIAGLAFYGGMKYSQNNRAGNARGGGQFGMFGMMRGSNGGFTIGQIIAKDDKSITIKLRDGSSKIVFYATSTAVTKSDSGTAADLTNAEQVMVVGTPNSDGSISASSIQIRPAQTTQN